MDGHVRDVKELRESCRSYLITSTIIRQASVTLTPYDTFLYINGECFVEKVSCTCVYNQSVKCKHVAGLIYFINNELQRLATNNSWGNPAPVSSSRTSTQKENILLK